MMKDLSQFLRIRSSLGGFLLKSCITKSMKDFLKHTMSKIQKPENDYFQTEKRWTKIYQSNRKSSFYKIINAHLSKIPPKNFVVEYGASIGIISNSLGLKHQHRVLFVVPNQVIYHSNQIHNHLFYLSCLMNLQLRQDYL